MSRTVVGTHSPTVPCLTDGLPHQLLAVLLRDDVSKTFIAYQGIVLAPANKTDAAANVAAVAARGSKLTCVEAQRHWPSISEDNYQGPRF